MTILPTYGAARNRTTIATAIIASGMICSMLVAQLFGYEDFSIVLSDITSITNSEQLSVLSASIIMGELLSLPYLLAMYISRLLRVTSAAAAFMIAGFWLISSLTNAHSANSALFSTSLSVPGGLIPAIWSLVLFILICRVIYADSRFRHAAPLR